MQSGNSDIFYSWALFWVPKAISLLSDDESDSYFFIRLKYISRWLKDISTFFVTEIFKIVLVFTFMPICHLLTTHPAPLTVLEAIFPYNTIFHRDFFHTTVFHKTVFRATFTAYKWRKGFVLGAFYVLCSSCSGLLWSYCVNIRLN